VLPRVYVSRRVQASHGVLHVVLVLRQGKRHEYSARQRGVQKGKRNVQGSRLAARCVPTLPQSG